MHKGDDGDDDDDDDDNNNNNNNNNKSFRKYVSNIPGKHEVKELQTTAILGTPFPAKMIMMMVAMMKMVIIIIIITIIIITSFVCGAQIQQYYFQDISSMSFHYKVRNRKIYTYFNVIFNFENCNLSFCRNIFSPSLTYLLHGAESFLRS